MAVLCWGGPRRQAERLASKIPLAGPREGPALAGWLQLGGLVARAPGRWAESSVPKLWENEHMGVDLLDQKFAP